jgi:hypothetical protein
MPMRKTASLLVVLAVAGCATPRSTLESLGSHSGCCNSFAELKYVHVAPDAPATITVEEARQVLTLPSGRSYVAAFELRAAPKTSGVFVRTVTTGFSETSVFCPTVMFLDASFAVVGQAIEPYLSEGPPRQHSALWFARLDIPERAKYLIAYTTDAALKKRLGFTWIPTAWPGIPARFNAKRDEVPCSHSGRLSVELQ